MATELGVAYLSLLPDMKGFGSAVTRELDQTGTRGGRTFASALGRSVGADKVGKTVATRFGVGLNGAIGGVVSRSAGIFAAGFAGIKVGGFLKDAIGQASDLSETTSKVSQIFGPAAKDILAFSKTSGKALGQTQQAALDANATFGIFGKAAGLQGQKLSGFTTNLTTLASDLASFNNTSPEQAIEAIGAALRGETEPMRAYGVLLDDASLRQEALSQGLIKTTKDALTPQQKVLAAQALIMKQTTTAQGDFARTSGGLANQQRILSARFGDFKTTVGAVALPLATKFFGFMNDKAIPILQSVAARIKEFAQSDGFRSFLATVGTTATTAFGIFKTEVIPRLQEFGGFVTGTIVPAVGNLVAAFTPLAKDVGSAAVDVFTRLSPVLQSLGGFIRDTVVPAFRDFTGFLRDNSTLVGAVALGVGSMVVAFKAYQTALAVASLASKGFAAATAAVNFVMSLNPIGIVVLALVGLAAGLVYAYKNSETFRNIVNAVFGKVRDVAVGAFKAIVGAVSTAIGWVKQNWPLILAVIVGPFGLAVYAIAKHWESIKSAAQTALRFVVDKFLGFAGSILEGAAKAFGWVPGLGDKLKGASTEFGKFRDSVNAKLGGITDQTVNVGIKYSAKGVNLTTPSRVGGLALGGPGGPVRGPGSTTSDTAGIYALSNKEWVIRAKASQKYGDHAMASVNAGTATIIPNGGFATGGRPGLRINPEFPSISTLASNVTSNARTIGASFAGQLAKQLGINPGLNGALSFARSQAGKPYLWGGVGPHGYDCSGFLSALVNVAQGSNPFHRRFATGSMPGGVFQPGPGAFSVGWFRGNPGHTAGTINGVNVESRGGRGVVVGAGARGATNSLFNSGVYHLPGFANGGKVGDAPFDLLDPRGKGYMGDQAKQLLPKALSFDGGGLMPTGVGIYHNGTGRPEPVGHDVLRKGDLQGLIGQLRITNWHEGTGHFRLIAQDEIGAAGEFASTAGRMR